jgi:hypothetical protein
MMNGLASMFRVLSLVIRGHGTIFDRIDAKIDIAVDLGLGDAKRHQKGGCLRSYLLTMMLLIGISLLIMMFRTR